MDEKTIEIFRKLRDICCDIVKAGESGDEKEQESALGRFFYLMVRSICSTKARSWQSTEMVVAACLVIAEKTGGLNQFQIVGSNEAAVHHALLVFCGEANPEPVKDWKQDSVEWLHAKGLTDMVRGSEWVSYVDRAGSGAAKARDKMKNLK